MRIVGTGILVMLFAWKIQAQWQVVPDQQPQTAFGGPSQKVTVQFRNAGEHPIKSELRMGLLQTSAATAVRIAELPWKQLQILPGQTIVESAALDFPAVKAQTRFLVQWLEVTNHIFGSTVVMVYPTNLLARLKMLAGDKPVGLFDPNNELKPLLRPLAVDFVDMQEEGTDKYHGKLAIFGPFESRAQQCASRKDDIQTLAKRGVAVVWLQPPPPDRRATLKPSFYAVTESESTVIVAAHDLVVGLAEHPEAQLNLLRLVEAALHPTAPTLPEIETSN